MDGLTYLLMSLGMSAICSPAVDANIYWPSHFSLLNLVEYIVMKLSSQVMKCLPHLIFGLEMRETKLR